jgi:hypothetical protein
VVILFAVSNFQNAKHFPSPVAFGDLKKEVPHRQSRWGGKLSASGRPFDEVVFRMGDESKHKIAPFGDEVVFRTGDQPNRNIAPFGDEVVFRTGVALS